MTIGFRLLRPESDNHVVCQGALARSCNPGGPERADDAIPSGAFGIGDEILSEENGILQRNALLSRMASSRVINGSRARCECGKDRRSHAAAVVIAELSDSALRQDRGAAGMIAVRCQWLRDVGAVGRVAYASQVAPGMNGGACHSSTARTG